ncbi:MAG: outer membrane beta-barrel protein [Betaproteobacteria bacterium]|nr:outer membrane beta-barrel protein [Betaproteobacteria bacterium]
MKKSTRVSVRQPRCGRKHLAWVIGVLFCAAESARADPPTLTPGVSAGPPAISGELLRQQGNPAVPVTPISPTDVLSPEALSSAKPQPGGLRAGSFLFYPDLSVSELYDSNLYSTRTDEVHDWATVWSPTLAVRSNWAHHSLNFWTGADAERYRTHSSEDVTDEWFEGQGRYDISQKSNVYAGGGISRNHEDRYNIDPARTGLTPTVFWDTKANAGGFHRFGRTSLRIGATYEHLRYENVAAPAGGMIDNSDRDVTLTSVGGRAAWQLTPRYQAFAQMATDTRRYDMSGVGRDSNGYRAAVGLGLDLGGNNTAEAYFGHMRQRYDNSAYSTLSKPYFGASAKFAISPMAYVTGFVDRTLEETTLPGSSGYLDTVVGARIDQDVTQNLAVNGRLAIEKSQFQGIDRQDNYLDAGFGAKYYVSREIYLVADYRMLLRRSNATTAVVNGVQDTFDFARNQAFVGIGYTPGRVPRADDPGDALSSETAGGGGSHGSAAAPTDYSGLYLGGLLGANTLSSEVFSPRSGEGGTDEMDMANDGGVSEAAFVGYGWMWKRWYAGVELEGGSSDASWFHQKNKADAHTMSLAQKQDFGASLRLGYALQGGLLYGSVGRVRSHLKTYDTENLYAATGAAALDQHVSGTRYGVGLDIPATERLFVRTAYTYTDYGSYGATYQTGSAATTTDQYSDADGVFELGLGWRLGGAGRQRREPRPAASADGVAGFYVGAQVGADSLTTRLDAVQNDGGGSGCTNCAFTGDFGKTAGNWGFFTGYGLIFHRVYLGLDLDAESSNAGWENARTTSGGGGRTFGVELKESIGAGVRLGYVLSNGALLYARGGQVRSRFDTTYAKGNSTATWVDRDDVLSGTRFGVGVEVPAYGKLFLKMEYDVTRYGAYGFTTTQHLSDTPSFKNEDSVFNMGLVLHF